MSKPIDDARQLIETRLAEIRAESEDLERALGGLGEGTDRRRGRRPSSRRRTSKRADADSVASGRPSRSTPRRKVGKRAAKGERGAQLLAAIKASPGARPSELAASIGITPTHVSVLIAKARSEKLIVKSGRGYGLKS